MVQFLGSLDFGKIWKIIKLHALHYRSGQPILKKVRINQPRPVIFIPLLMLFGPDENSWLMVAGC